MCICAVAQCCAVSSCMLRRIYAFSVMSLMYRRMCCCGEILALKRGVLRSTKSSL